MQFIPEKKLGFGLMRLPQNDPINAADVDVEQVKKMVDLFMEKGFTYFDTAIMYHNLASEAVVKKALVDRYPRESYTLADKIHCEFFRDADDQERYFQKQLEKTGVSYFDYYLVHGVEADLLTKYEKCDTFNFVLEKKAQGLVKHAGFSFHGTAELLEELLTKYPDMEFVQIQMNYLDWESEWIQSRAVYEVAEKHGKPVIVMEPVKGGTLANMPADAEKIFKDYDPSKSTASWAIRFVATYPNVMVVLSGMSSLEQMEDNVSYMDDFKPLTDEEKEMCFKVAEVINAQTAIPCTACHYCTSGCPMNIAIPEYFSIYNEDMRENLKEKGWTANFVNYELLTRKAGRPADCVQCGQCEGVCPQHLPIIEYLKDCAAHFDAPHH